MLSAAELCTPLLCICMQRMDEKMDISRFLLLLIDRLMTIAAAHRITGFEDGEQVWRLGPTAHIP